MSEATCQWRQTDDEHTPDTWQADCGAMWTFTDGGPKDNDMNFCPKCGKPLSQIDNAMTDKPDPYSSEAETQALLVPDTRTAAERKLAQMMAERGADEQSAEAYLILRQIALEFLAEQPAPVQPTYKDSTPHLSVGESLFESWFGVYALNLQCVSSKQMARDAYAAGMGDPLVMAAPVQQEACPTCGEYEPRTGTCGTSPNDKRALCNRNTPQPAQPQQEPVVCRLCSSSSGSWSWQCHKCGEFDDTRAPSPQPAQQEHVAYLVYAKASRRYFTLTFDVDKVPEIYKGGEAVPLYTSPPAQRKPLTEEQLNVAWHDRWANPSLPNTPYGSFVGGVRFAEAAHGIKEQP